MSNRWNVRGKVQPTPPVCHETVELKHPRGMNYCGVFPRFIAIKGWVQCTPPLHGTRFPINQLLIQTPSEPNEWGQFGTMVPGSIINYLVNLFCQSTPPTIAVAVNISTGTQLAAEFQQTFVYATYKAPILLPSRNINKIAGPSQGSCQIDLSVPPNA